MGTFGLNFNLGATIALPSPATLAAGVVPLDPPSLLTTVEALCAPGLAVELVAGLLDVEAELASGAAVNVDAVGAV